MDGGVQRRQQESAFRVLTENIFYIERKELYAKETLKKEILRWGE